MRTTAGVLFALTLFLSSCVPVDLATFTSPRDESADGNAGAWWTSKPDPPKNLFADADLAPSVGTSLSASPVVSLLSFSLPADTWDLTPPATFTFQGNGPPRVWSGAVSLAAAPVNLLGGFYDFTNVASIRFLIKTAIDPAHLSVVAQVGPKATDQNTLTFADLTPGKDLNTWTLIRVPTSSLYLANSDLKKVIVPLGIFWGSANFDTILTAGASFQIGEIAFEDASGAQVALGAQRSVATFPTTLPPVPTLLASSVTSLYTSSGTYTNVDISDWNADWLQNGYLTNTKIAGKNVKVLNLSDYQGINITTSGSLAGATTSLLNLNSGGKSKLHLSYWSSNAGPLNVDFLHGPSNGTVSHSWDSVTLVSQQWTDLDFDLPADVMSGAAILSQLKFTNETNAGSGTFGSVQKVLYLDNIYFH